MDDILKFQQKAPERPMQGENAAVEVRQAAAFELIADEIRSLRAQSGEARVAIDAVKSQGGEIRIAIDALTTRSSKLRTAIDALATILARSQKSRW